MSVSIENRLFLVTGANSGIGKATALGLARLGGTVVMACRDATRGEATRQDMMRESGNPRVFLEIADLEGERRYNGYRAYGQSKLAQILFTRELAQHLEGTGVTVNACYPGVIRTNLGIGGASVVVRFVRMFFKGPARGAETPIYLATSPDVEGG